MSARSYLVLGLALLACGDGASGSSGVARRLDECGLLRGGELNLSAHGDIEACIAACRVNASCRELKERYCEREASEKLLSCEAACFSPTACASGRGFYTALQRCDGAPDCDDGSDEDACEDAVSPPRFCASSGERIWRLQLCNGYEDCEDGSDELNCPDKEEQFVCTRIPQRVPKSKVCDLEPDCLDNSDESTAQGCAQLICR